MTAPNVGGKPPLLRNTNDPIREIFLPPPLSRIAAQEPNKPFKFTDSGPSEKLKKGDPLEPDTEYRRINIGVTPEQQARDNFNQIQRVAGEEREPYAVEIEATMTRVGGMIFDTGECKKLVAQMGAELGAAKLGSVNGHEFTVPQDWRDEAIMWVCMAPPGGDTVTFYSSVCQPNVMHHSSFGFDGVIAAGEWIVRKGKLKKISANSGHFRPSIDALYRAVLHLACARQADSTIFLYDTKLCQWVDVSWGDFIAKPTGGGRYSTHPDAPFPKAI